MIMDVTNSLEETIQEVADLETESTASGSSSTTEINQNVVAPSEYASMYKTNTSISFSQDKRREMFLALQKKNRNKTFDENRDISEICDCDENSDIEIDSKNCENWVCVPELMDIVNSYKGRKHKRRKPRHMLSEWMVEVPNDLESEWLVKFCPVGVRNLIVANNFKTTAYNKHGKLLAVFNSNLPAGNSNSNRNSTTILDGIYNYKRKCYYILDILMWNDCNFIQSPAALRFFFLKSKLNEVPVQEISQNNKSRFVEIPEFPAELNVIEENLAQPFRENDEIVPLDGVLFYHKETWYKQGFTPLVGWLKPYMIPEKLQIPVCEYFNNSKPSDYVSLEQYLLNRQKNKGDVVMENADDVQEKME